MASEALDGRKVAIVVNDGFEQVETTAPRKARDNAGAETTLVSPKGGSVKAWKFIGWGDRFPVDRPLGSTAPENYGARLLPGGVTNPDTLRTLPEAVVFAREFLETAKPVASICHGPWTIIEASAARGRRLTSWPSLKSDLQKAGADWMDQEAVVDLGLVTSRKPDNVPACNREMIELFAGGQRQSWQAAAE